MKWRHACNKRKAAPSRYQAFVQLGLNSLHDCASSNAWSGCPRRIQQRLRLENKVASLGSKSIACFMATIIRLDFFKKYYNLKYRWWYQNAYLSVSIYSPQIILLLESLICSWFGFSSFFLCLQCHLKTWTLCQKVEADFFWI